MILAFDKGVFGTQWLVTVFGGAYAIFFPDSEIDVYKRQDQGQLQQEMG